jgi:hypothetical protein
VEDWRSVWVGGFSPFSTDDDLLVVWEFELLLQKEEETLEHYGSWLVFFVKLLILFCLFFI